MAIGCITLTLIGHILITPIYLIIALTLFVIASLTDKLDGFLARKRGIVSEAGAILDPISDKVLTLGIFLTFAYIIPIAVNIWLVIIIMAREILITVIRLYYKKKGIVISAKRLGKMKTLSQIIVINYTFVLYIIVLAFPLPPNPEVFMLYEIVPIMMWFVVFITVLSGLAIIYRIITREKEESS